MTMHVNKKTGEISSPDEIIERARELDAQVSKLDEAIEEQREALKETKASRDKLLRELRAVVRPVPLFDQPVVAEGTRVTMRMADQPKDAAVDITDALNAAGLRRKQH